MSLMVSERLRRGTHLVWVNLGIYKPDTCIICMVELSFPLWYLCSQVAWTPVSFEVCTVTSSCNLHLSSIICAKYWRCIWRRPLVVIALISIVRQYITADTQKERPPDNGSLCLSPCVVPSFIAWLQCSAIPVFL
jgi:hypothetical protein